MMERTACAHELQAAGHTWTASRIINNGAFGTVLSVVNESCEACAMKVQSMVSAENLAIEGGILARLHAASGNSEFLPWIFGASASTFRDHEFFAIIMEEGTMSLEDARKGNLISGRRDVLSIAWSLAESLNHLHNQGLVHADVKTGNALLSSRVLPDPNGTCIKVAILIDLGACANADTICSMVPLTTNQKWPSVPNGWMRNTGSLS